MSFRVSFCSCVFNPFSIAITSLEEERANLSAFRTFVRFLLVWIGRFPLPIGFWERLRFVIVALPGLFSYLFFQQGNPSMQCPNSGFQFHISGFCFTEVFFKSSLVIL